MENIILVELMQDTLNLAEGKKKKDAVYRRNTPNTTQTSNEAELYVLNSTHTQPQNSPAKQKNSKTS